MKFCIMECFCFATGRGREDFEQILGHDGTRLIAGTAKQTSFTLEEMLFASRLMDFKPTLFEDDKYITFFLYYPNHRNLILFNRTTSHCIASKYGEIYDLQNKVTKLKMFKTDAVVIF